MALFQGKKGLILGVANDRSIAWAVAKTIMDQGGECGFTHLPDRPEDDKQKNRRRVAQCLEGYPQARFLVPLNVQDDEQIEHVVHLAADTFGSLDFVLHSIAFADRADLQRPTVETSREGFRLAMEVSAYSLIAVTNAVKGYMSRRGAIAAMSFFGGEKCVPGYNVMGLCKAALESAVRYLAFDMGARGVRVNALSAGPLKTLASSAVGANAMFQLYRFMAPLGRNVTHKEVGQAGAFLLSEMSDGITGEILHVDGGYNVMGSPGRLLDALKDPPAESGALI